jgi:Cu(I)/Ag(I) efflux system membrane protein CusA/SilA
VQTGVVMVIYLEEAVHRKRAAMGGRLTRTALREAVIDGALLRLRPKVMTVSTVIAGLLPIMWSTRVGAEVMKPLATPVLGGMVSSLVHVLIVTPVLFFWLQERRLGLNHEPLVLEQRPAVTRRRLVISMGVIVAVVAAVALVQTWRAHRSVETSAGSPVQEIRSGEMTITVFSPTGTLHQGRNVFTIEFRGANGSLVDVGAVRTSANMTMPGMAMSGGVQVSQTTAGRYQATAEFGMAGAWQMAIEWDGPAGRGSVNFEGTVR